MTEPTFTRDGTTALYWADPQDRVAAFLSSTPSLLGSTPTLTRTWQDASGSYVFLGAAVADPAAFLAALLTWTGLYTPQHAPRFLWIADPGGAPDRVGDLPADRPDRP